MHAQADALFAFPFNQKEAHMRIQLRKEEMKKRVIYNYYDEKLYFKLVITNLYLLWREIIF